MAAWVNCDVTVNDRPCILLTGHSGAHAVRPTWAEILHLEAAHPQEGPGRYAAIGRLHLPRARYYQFLNQMLDDPAAQQTDPTTIHRLQRIRDRHRTNRARWFNAQKGRS